KDRPRLKWGGKSAPAVEGTYDESATVRQPDRRRDRRSSIEFRSRGSRHCIRARPGRGRGRHADGSLQKGLQECLEGSEFLCKLEWYFAGYRGKNRMERKDAWRVELLLLPSAD